MFGQNNPIYGQIPQGPSIPGVTPEMMMLAQQKAAPKGMFGGGGKVSIDLGRAIAGYLAGIGNPAGAQTLNAMNAMRQQQLEHQQNLDDYNRKRADDRSDFTFEQDYKAAHDTPDISQRIAVLNSITPGLGDTYAKNYAQNGGGMGPVMVNPTTGQTMVPAGKAPAQEPPTEAIQRLRANPSEAAQFDEIFGPGASSKILGGPTPGASGGFL